MDLHLHRVHFLVELSEQPIINDMHKTNFQFPDKYDTKSFEHTTVLTSAPQNVYQHKQNRVPVYSWNRSYLYLADIQMQQADI